VLVMAAANPLPAGRAPPATGPTGGITILRRYRSTNDQESSRHPIGASSKVAAYWWITAILSPEIRIGRRSNRTFPKGLGNLSGDGSCDNHDTHRNGLVEADTLSARTPFGTAHHRDATHAWPGMFALCGDAVRRSGLPHVRPYPARTYRTGRRRRFRNILSDCGL
jgi:hypothetical protein